MSERVVVTGMGVCAPNGIGLKAFEKAMAQGISGIQHQPELETLQFSCQVAGSPDLSNVDMDHYFSKLQQRSLLASGLLYGTIAGLDAWTDAQLPVNGAQPDWDSGTVFGTGILGVDVFRDAIHLVDAHKVRRLRSATVVQTMASGISAHLGGTLGLGNWVTTNSSACATGTEALLMGFEHIATGKAKRMLVGSCSDSGPYVWVGFDAMRILPTSYNHIPERASRPMSTTASGFVPGSGAGALILESLKSAQQRKAPIYCELLGGAVNSGGQRNGGSITAANPEGIQQCIAMALSNTGVNPKDIEAINGHLTATTKDPDEIDNWCTALHRSEDQFPFINSFKGHFGHCLAASGSIECVATVLQFKLNQLFGTLNSEDIHPKIAELITPKRVVTETINFSPKIIAKASFGFGDVNACAIFKAYS
ncbi:MAG: beta-ketoacyl-[acyl-carrier-protein] synthase family protein [Bacteroidota bacterium]